jgi:hypothetical protein
LPFAVLLLPASGPDVSIVSVEDVSIRNRRAGPTCRFLSVRPDV